MKEPNPFDFRLGSFVKDSSGCYVRVNYLRETKDKTFEIGTTSTLPILPIVLSNDTLKEFGFVDNKYLGVVFDISPYSCICFKEGIVSYYTEERDQNEIIKDVEYLHQIQNIIFDLGKKQINPKI